MSDRDPQLDSLLQRLAGASTDPMLLVWRYVTDIYEDGDCCKALRIMVAGLLAQNDGRVARESRNFDSCPYQAFEGAPLKTSDYLRLAWMSGYDAADTKTRCDQAERKIYDAHKSLGDVRSRFIESKSELQNSMYDGFAKSICNIHGTILTSAVKRRIIEEERAKSEPEL